MRLRINKVGLDFDHFTHLERPEYGDQSELREAHGILVFCPRCGTELYGEWDYVTYSCFGRLYSPEQENRRNALYDATGGRQAECEAEAEQIRNINKCPVCSGALRKDYGFYLELGSFFDEDDDRLLDYRDKYWGYVKETRFSVGKESERSRKWKQLVDYTGYCGSEEYGYKEFLLDLGYEHMREERKEQETAQNLVDEKTALFDLPVFELIPAEKLDTVRNTPAALKTYVHNLIKLENDIYSLSKRLGQLYLLRFDNERSICREQYMSAGARVVRQEISDAEAVYTEACKKLEQVRNEEPTPVVVVFPVEPAYPQLEKPGLFNKKKVQAENDQKTRQYEAEMEQYRQAVAECEKEKARREAENKAELERMISEAEKNVQTAKAVLDTLNTAAPQKLASAAEAPNPAKAIARITEKEIEEAEELLKKLYEGRNKLYGYDIIFSKYRNVVALSSFYEYLMAGRCDSLEGANGAYNIYEGEIRMNQVISQLSAVLDSLEQIKGNQYMIYTELQGIRSGLDRLNSTMNRALTSIQNIEANTNSMTTYMEQIAKNSDVIAHNTAATAYYAKMNAELTNALGFMVALG